MIPTQPGHYWRRTTGHDDIVKVDIILESRPDDLYYWEINEIGCTYIQEEQGVEWLGPVMSIEETQLIIDTLLKVSLLTGVGLENKQPEGLLPIVDEINKLLTGESQPPVQ